MKSILAAAVLLAASSANAQYLLRDLPNNFTGSSVIPYGCLTVVPTAHDAPPLAPFADERITVVDTAGSGVVRIRAWRIGCHEPNASAIAVNFLLESGSDAIPYPRVRLVTPDLQRRSAGLFHFARTGFYLPDGASYSSMVDQGLATAVEGVSLIVDTDEAAISKVEYNAELVLELDWPSSQFLALPIPAYDEDRDLPQFAAPVFNGRYTGQWIIQGLPRQGMALQVAELPPDRNFVFVTFYTYMDGVPVWVVGNADFAIGATAVVVDLWMLNGGEFFTEHPGSYAREDVVQERLGTITLWPRQCNIIDSEIDFAASGLGTVNRRFERLIRIAGYDCDQTR
jgi:hypothetical protein